MKVIFGSAGQAKEVDWFLYEISKQKGAHHRLDYYIGNEPNDLGIHGVPIITESDFLPMIKNSVSVEAYIAIGSPVIRRKIWDKFKDFSPIHYPVLIHPSVFYDERQDRVKLGTGSILCAGTVLTTDVTIGDFVHVNINSTIAHDTQIGNFCTISPGCNISGNVILGENVFLGTNAKIIERISICNDVIIGAGSLVTKSITEPGTYVGIPAKKIK